MSAYKSHRKIKQERSAKRSGEHFSCTSALDKNYQFVSRKFLIRQEIYEQNFQSEEEILPFPMDAQRATPSQYGDEADNG